MAGAAAALTGPGVVVGRGAPVGVGMPDALPEVRAGADSEDPDAASALGRAVGLTEPAAGGGVGEAVLAVGVNAGLVSGVVAGVDRGALGACAVKGGDTDGAEFGAAAVKVMASASSRMDWKRTVERYLSPATVQQRQTADRNWP